MQSDMIDSVLIQQSKQLLGCDKDAFFVYDDSQKYEDRKKEADLFRVVTGAHSDEICCISYNYELSLIATGAVSGEIAIYDYERSNLLDFCIAHDSEIT